MGFNYNIGFVLAFFTAYLKTKRVILQMQYLTQNRVKRGPPEVLYGMEALPGGSRRVIKQSLPVPTGTKGNVY